VPEEGGTAPVTVVFVCWGNICRSPIAERVARQKAEEAGLTGVAFSSAATSTEELGHPMDRRAAAVLRDRGYDADGHVAHQADAAEVTGADLVVAMEDLHVDRLRRIAPGADNLALLTDFDPAATPGSGVPDPWYGTPEGFYDTLAAVEAAVPGVLDRVREIQASRAG
jgi:protein-tyrosine phosphatase